MQERFTALWTQHKQNEVVPILFNAMSTGLALGAKDAREIWEKNIFTQSRAVLSNSVLLMVVAIQWIKVFKGELERQLSESNRCVSAIALHGTYIKLLG